MVERKKNLELKKHVAAIHSSNKLSLLQRKIANALLFNAYEELLEKDEHVIHVATLCKLIGYDSNDSKTIKKSLVNLLATVIEWNLVDGSKLDAEGIWNASSIIADASIDGPLCTYSYSNKMKKLLYRPELYGRLNMLVQAKFQSSYGLALYENCIRYQGIEQTPWFDMNKFRKLMGVEEGKYKIFRDFKNRVLDKAIEELNKYSPIKVTPKFQKEKRQVIAIQFLIEHRKETEIALVENKHDFKSLSGVLKSRFGLSKKQSEEVMTSYDGEYIREKMAIIEASTSFASGKINNLAKYLMSALQEDYQATKTSRNVLELKRLDREQQEKQKQLERQQAEEFYRFQNKEIIKIFEKYSDIKRKKILLEFSKFLGKGIYGNIYMRDGLSNILIQDQLCVFIRDKYPQTLEQISSYEEYYVNNNDIEKVKSFT